MRRLFPLAVALVLGLSACSSDSGSGGKRKSGKDERPPRKDESPPPPCHPGCFPAGTLIDTPAGPRPIEAIGRDDLVTLVGRDGTRTTGRVASTFQTCSRLVEVRTEAGNLLTTPTQPLCLHDGGFRRAGELAEGDLVCRWQDGKRRPVRIRAVVATEREAAVHNLVVGESAVFIAGGFLARGKPPPAADSPGLSEGGS